MLTCLLLLVTIKQIVLFLQMHLRLMEINLMKFALEVKVSR
jgi:hypothetical protein